jgi:hypothetical protein
VTLGYLSAHHQAFEASEPGFPVSAAAHCRCCCKDRHPLIFIGALAGERYGQDRWKTTA